MLCCEHCQSPKHLRITKSHTTVSNDHTQVLKIHEYLKCRECGLEGTATADLESETLDLSGGLVDSPERPRATPRVGGGA
ncbi:hypothetical protein HTZ84_22170 [Haloterrigena sp. SYSU A558-1]|uniref:YgiT-type zinc finger domain-containing protein n=1 Tax=Haloterrigena gelatinilytica TaxID=2741724 RepID=A0ABX2LII7_9EURY|nr:hypothetical protein [Haloterrigena gelatinilytica]NUC74974.1 hypothetical protein [Haloterrigena gelatinilytica]